VDFAVLDAVADDVDVRVARGLTVVDDSADAEEGCDADADSRVVALTDAESVSAKDGTVAAADDDGGSEIDGLADVLVELELAGETELDGVDLVDVSALPETDADLEGDAVAADDAVGGVVAVAHTEREAELLEERDATDADGSLDTVLVTIDDGVNNNDALPECDDADDADGVARLESEDDELALTLRGADALLADERVGRADTESCVVPVNSIVGVNEVDADSDAMDTVAVSVREAVLQDNAEKETDTVPHALAEEDGSTVVEPDILSDPLARLVTDEECDIDTIGDDDAAVEIVEDDESVPKLDGDTDRVPHGDAVKETETVPH
jgi:hypothetical protein